MTASMPHKPRHRHAEDPHDSEPGPLPVDPDEGPLPPAVPDQGEHDRPVSAGR